MTGTICGAFFALLALLIAPAPAMATETGFSDDAVIGEGNAAALVASAAAHNATVVRTIVRPNHPRERFVALAEEAAAAGMTVHATIDFPYGDAGQMSVADHAHYVRESVAALVATGVHLRVAILNEPDLFMPAEGSCDPHSAEVVLHTVGQEIVRRTVFVKTRRYRTIRRVVRKAGKRRVVIVKVAVSKRVKVVKRVHGKRRVTYRMVPVYYKRPVTTTSVTPTLSSSSTVVLTPRRACHAILRARAARPYIASGIAAARAAGAHEVDATETSPIPGWEVFIAEIARLGLPAFDGWAHHPYGGDVAGARAVVTEAFGAIPLDFTEFGVSREFSNEHAAAEWTRVGQAAKAVEARSLVAYQVQPQPTHSWDTSLLDSGMTRTPQGDAFARIK